MREDVVTLSDCSKALNAIEEQIEDLKRQKTQIERNINALLTQGLLINQLIRRIV